MDMAVRSFLSYKAGMTTGETFGMFAKVRQTACPLAVLSLAR
jgi:hypothetical protein